VKAGKKVKPEKNEDERKHLQRAVGSGQKVQELPELFFNSMTYCYYPF
jgi:hypothetical protein